MEAQHIPEESLFLIRLPDGTQAHLKYILDEDKMYITSTYTPPRHRGRGIAAKLMEAALLYARKNNLEVIPVCSYAKHYMQKIKGG